MNTLIPQAKMDTEVLESYEIVVLCALALGHRSLRPIISAMGESHGMYIIDAASNLLADEQIAHISPRGFGEGGGYFITESGRRYLLELIRKVLGLHI